MFQKPVFKVWNRDRNVKRSCVATSLKELKRKGTDNIITSANSVWYCFQSHTICLCLSVCLSVCSALTFETLDIESLFFGMQIHLQNIPVKFAFQSHRIQVKSRSHEQKYVRVSCLRVDCLRFKGSLFLPA